MSMYEIEHFVRKLSSTIKIVCTLFMARTFGRYEISIYDHGLSYAKYHWRGKVWAIPTEPLEINNGPVSEALDFLSRRDGYIDWPADDSRSC